MKKLYAFTLAELLITLAIIGVVAAVVLPSLMTNINDKVNAEKIRSTKYKFTKATDHMKSLGLIGPYNSTDDFVDELQKYFKIAKRCDANHLRACWPTDTVKLDNGKEWNIADTKTGKNLKMEKNDFSDYTSDNVGIITADGTPMILSYNKKCQALDPMKTYEWSTSNGKPETNATAGCVAAVFEINGHSRPNTFRKDVVAFNANGLGNACTIEIDGKCFGTPFKPTPMKYSECAGENATSSWHTTEAGSYAKSLGIEECYFTADYWAGVVKQCGGIQNLPTMKDIEKLESIFYDNYKYNGKGTEFGFPEPEFYVWSADVLDATTTRYMIFRTEYGLNWNSQARNFSQFLGLCLTE